MPTYYTAITSSLTTIGARTNNGIRDQYFKGGQCLMVRPFTESLVASGSWVELWLGFRWRMNLGWNWPALEGTSPTQKLWMENYHTVGVGICDTSGLVAGETGSKTANSDISHSLGVNAGFNAGLMYGVQYRDTSTTITSSFAYSSVLVNSYVTGSRMLAGSGVQAFVIPTNISSSQNRNFWLMRFATSSGDPKSWIVSVMRPYANEIDSSGLRTFTTDWSASMQLVDLFTFNSWTGLTAYAQSLGYGISNFSAISTDQKTNGFFDGIYIEWPKYWDNIEISDVVVRAITSSVDVAW